MVSVFNIPYYGIAICQSHSLMIILYLYKMPQPFDNLVTALQSYGKVATT